MMFGKLMNLEATKGSFIFARSLIHVRLASGQKRQYPASSAKIIKLSATKAKATSRHQGIGASTLV